MYFNFDLYNIQTNNLKDGQNITDNISIYEIRRYNHIPLGYISYYIESGEVMAKSVSNQYVEIVFNDVMVYAEMTNIIDEVTHRTYKLQGSLRYKKIS